MLNILYFTKITEISLERGLSLHICFGVFCPEVAGVSSPTLNTRQEEIRSQAGPAGAVFLRALAARFVSFAAREKKVKCESGPRKICAEFGMKANKTHTPRGPHRLSNI